MRQRQVPCLLAGSEKALRPARGLRLLLSPTRAVTPSGVGEVKTWMRRVLAADACLALSAVTTCTPGQLLREEAPAPWVLRQQVAMARWSRHCPLALEPRHDDSPSAGARVSGCVRGAP